VSKCSHREYGPADIIINKFGTGADALLEGFGGEMRVRISLCVMTRILHFNLGMDVPRRSAFKTSA